MNAPFVNALNVLIRGLTAALAAVLLLGCQVETPLSVPGAERFDTPFMTRTSALPPTYEALSAGTARGSEAVMTALARNELRDPEQSNTQLLVMLEQSAVQLGLLDVLLARYHREVTEFGPSSRFVPRLALLYQLLGYRGLAGALVYHAVEHEHFSPDLLLMISVLVADRNTGTDSDAADADPDAAREERELRMAQCLLSLRALDDYAGILHFGPSWIETQWAAVPESIQRAAAGDLRPRAAALVTAAVTDARGAAVQPR